MLQSLATAKLVAIAEADPVNRAAAGRLAPTCTLFEDFQDLLRSGAIDAVVICLPPHLHAASAIAAFQARLHVYVEKPLAPSMHEGAAVVSAWQAAGTIGMMGFNFRFHPQVRAVRAHLERHAIGRMLAVRGSFTILPHAIPGWKQHRSLGGGCSSISRRTTSTLCATSSANRSFRHSPRPDRWQQRVTMQPYS